MAHDVVYKELASLLNPDKLLKDAAMSEYTSFQAGGRADLLIVPGTLEELTKTLKILTCYNVDTLVMGNGTNLLVRDGGFRGAIVKIGAELGSMEVKGNVLSAGAGALLKDVAAFALAQGLSGLEFASGIPGSLGGAAFMNAGAYGGEMSQIVDWVRVVSKNGDQITTFTVEEMAYGYRQSHVMETKEIVISAGLLLTEADPVCIAERMAEFSAKRKEKQPLDVPSAGSFFKRPPGSYAGKLIEEAGLKGRSLGGAAISQKHAGFLVNENHATAADIISLMKVVQEEVYKNSGVLLEPEIWIVGEEC